MTRTDVRRRALRAAMAVTLGTAMLGCGTTVTDPGRRGGDGGSTSADGGGATTPTDPIASTATAGGSDASAGGASGTGGAAQASSSSTGGVDAKKCDMTAMTPDAYTKCCQSVNWDFNQGCEAWGPPMPPSMDWRPEEVA
jgi:hypothetical protein